MNVLKRHAVPSSRVHQLDDPAGTSPAITDGGCVIAGTESPAHLPAMAGLEIADLDREVPVPAELGNDRLIPPARVVFDRQEQLGDFFRGALKNAGEVWRASAWISTPSSSTRPNRSRKVESQGALGSSRSLALRQLLRMPRIAMNTSNDWG